ncbi:MAG: PEP-CTERM sorting domain-containing protein [Planctomycetota bacterium]
MLTSFGNTSHAVDASFVGSGLDGVGDFLKGPVTPGTFQPPGDALQAGFLAGEVRHPVMSFQLPVLAPDEVVVSASLSFQRTFNQGQPTGYTLDLDFIGVDPVELAASDFEAPVVATVADDFVTPDDDGTPGTDPGFTGFFEILTFDVTSLISSNYADGEFAAFRITVDGDPVPAAFNGYNFAANNATVVPILTIETVIPEPASLALVALGGVALLGRRRTA